MFKDKIALVTGASSGIGFGIAKRFVEEGAMVIGLGSTEKSAAGAKAALADDRFIERQCNVADEAQILALKDFVQNEYGKLDMLVNNAGVGKLNISPEEVTEDNFGYHYETNVKGPFLLVKHFVPLLKKSVAPAIVNITSAVAFMEVPNHLLYSTSKAAMEKFTRHLVRDLPGIRANSIAPGWVNTPIIEKAGISGEEKEAFLEFMKTKIPVGRVGLPEDIAELVLFICSEKASYINGASIIADGGWTCNPDWGI